MQFYVSYRKIVEESEVTWSLMQALYSAPKYVVCTIWFFVIPLKLWIDWKREKSTSKTHLQVRFPPVICTHELKGFEIIG